MVCVIFPVHLCKYQYIFPPVFLNLCVFLQISVTGGEARDMCVGISAENLPRSEREKRSMARQTGDERKGSRRSNEDQSWRRGKLRE